MPKGARSAPLIVLPIRKWPRLQKYREVGLGSRQRLVGGGQIVAQKTGSPSEQS